MAADKRGWRLYSITDGALFWAWQIRTLDRSAQGGHRQQARWLWICQIAHGL